MSPQPAGPDRVAHYRVEELLGEGGAGRVFKAYDTRLERPVALKFLRAGSGEQRARFTREAQMIASLHHPNIAVIHDLDLEAKEPYLVLEYLPGGTLEERAADRPMPLTELVEYGRDIAAALDHAHGRGVVHRDVKPRNVLFSETGELKLADFGLARLTGENTLATSDGIRGTPAYLSPEQARGEEAGPASDLFSLGVTLYRLAAGKLPFRADHPAALIHQILEGEPEPLARLRPDLPDWFCRMVSCLLAKRPKDRPPSARALFAGAALVGGASASTLTWSTPAAAAPRRWKRLAWLGIPVLAVLALVPLYDSIFGPELPAERRLAVLPFDNIGGGAEDAAFCEGISETLASLLTQSQAAQNTLAVFPTSELRQHKVRTPREARKAFNATLAITGSVQRIGTDYRVILNLVDARVLRQLDSRIVDLPRDALGGTPQLLLRHALELVRTPVPVAANRFAVFAATADPTAYELATRARALLGPARSAVEARQAVGLLEAALKLEPRYALAHALLAEARLTEWRASRDKTLMAQADQSATRAVELNPALPEAYLARAHLAQRTGMPERAAADFRRALELDPVNLEALRGLAAALSAAGLNEEARRTLERAARSRPSYWPLRGELGDFYYRAAEYDKAVEEFRVVTGLIPENAYGYQNLGGALAQRGLLAEAAVQLEKGLQIQPSARMYENLANVRWRQGDLEAAARMFEKATELNPNDAVSWGNFAEAAAQTAAFREKSRGAFETAIRLAREGLGVNPRQPSLGASLALYLARTGASREARAALGEALRQPALSVAVRFKAARVYEILGDRGRALAELRRALAEGYPIQEVNSETDFVKLRQDPRFAALVRPASKRSKQ